MPVTSPTSSVLELKRLGQVLKQIVSILAGHVCRHAPPHILAFVKELDRALPAFSIPVCVARQCVAHQEHLLCFCSFVVAQLEGDAKI